MANTAQRDGGEPAHALPHPRDLGAAVGLLTVLPCGRPDPHGDAAARAALFFPVVGAAIGAGLAGLSRLLGDQSDWLAAVVLAGVWQLLTGSPRDRTQMTVAGAATVIKVAVLVAASGTRGAALLFAPLLARWAMVVIATGARDAQVPARKFNPGITFREFALTSVFTLAIVLALAEAAGVLLIVAVAAVSLAVRLSAHRWAGGITWPGLLAAAQAIEVVVVVLCAAL
jgi:cobalamin synthase